MRKLACLLWLTAAGCGSSVSADKACTDLANALCTKIQGCAAPLITLQYGDLATCEARAKIACLPSLMAANSSATPDKLDSCATAVGATTCTAIYTRDTPAQCKSDPGKLANGSACGDDAQCTSAYCKKAAAQVCGVCGTRAQAGGSCSVDADCDFKLACANQACAAYGAVGANCDSGRPCAAPNLCTGGTCVAPLGAGMQCDPLASKCDQTQGLYCHPMNRVCAMATFAGAGQACGLVNGGYVGCSGAGHCKMMGALMGTCLAPAADGAACDSTNGPDCMPPAQCVASVCKLPNPASCM